MDGLWIDMNEPSNFCNGACDRNFTLRATSSFDPNAPPYTIGNRRQRGGTNYVPLKDKTLDMDAVHHNGATAYDMHNLYGKGTRSRSISLALVEFSIRYKRGCKRKPHKISLDQLIIIILFFFFY